MAKRSLKWQKLLDEFEEAVKNYVFMGGAHPSLHRYIFEDYVETRKALVDYLKKGGG